MSSIRPRRLLAAASLTLAVAVVAPSSGHAATIKACKNKKTGALRVAKKCHKNEKRLKFSTKGAKGAAGANGANGANGKNGANGAPGEPRSARKFSGAQPELVGVTRVPLFSANGVTYSFQCSDQVLQTEARLYADATSGTTYAQGTLARPANISRQAGDPWSSTVLETLGGGPQVIASHFTVSSVSGSVQDNGVYTAVVEGPQLTHLLHFRMVASSNCSVKGIALALPNA